MHNSFIHGLNPMEFFFHAMSGREGVSDKLVSLTAGCLQREGKHCNPLVTVMNRGEISYNVGKSLIALTTTLSRETRRDTRGNDLGHGKNVKDWVIRG